MDRPRTVSEAIEVLNSFSPFETANQQAKEAFIQSIQYSSDGILGHMEYSMLKLSGEEKAELFRALGADSAANHKFCKGSFAGLSCVTQQESYCNASHCSST